MEKHFCGEVLVEVAIFSETHKCGIEMPDGAVIQKHCCKDVIEVVEGLEVVQNSSLEDLDFEQQQFIASFLESYASLYKNLPKQIIPHKDYSPPNLIANIQVLDQVFLI